MDAPSIRRRLHPLGSMLLFVVIMLVAGVGCGEPDAAVHSDPQGQAVETPAVALTPVVVDETADATETASRTFGILADDARAPISPRILVELSHLIVSGHVVAILPPRWTTPDAAVPHDVEATIDRREATIITPVVIELDGEPLVARFSPELPIDRTPHRVVVATVGGQVGTVRVETNFPEAQFEIGEHVMVLLSATDPNGVNPLVPTEEGLAWGVWHKYVLTPDGKAQSYDGYVSESTDELVTGIQDAAKNLPPLHPVSPVLPTVNGQRE